MVHMDALRQNTSPDVMSHDRVADLPEIRLETEGATLDDGVLAALSFGAGAAQALPDPRRLRVGLTPIGPSCTEVWRVRGGVRHGRDGALAWSEGGAHLFFAFDVPECEHGGIEAAARWAYERIGRFLAGSATPHPLRLWNYLHAINAGDGDAERYRLFCRGRADGMRAGGLHHYPAASAIGRQDGVAVLQVYGLAAARPGVAVENPRQVSAWRYPRQYGPTPPGFARGMRVGDRLLISGTAAVVGHASAHTGELTAQLDETLVNLASLIEQARPGAPSLGAGSVLKVYVRNAADGDFIATRLRQRMASLGGLQLLAGDICRGELLLEIDGIHGLSGA